MKRLGFYFIAALLGAIALATAFAAQSDRPPTVIDDAAVERPDVPPGPPDFVADRQEGEDGTADDQDDGNVADATDDNDAERDIKGIPDKSEAEGGPPEDSPARDNAPPFNWEDLTCVVELEDGTQVAVPNNAGRNMIAAGAATAPEGTCDGPGPGQGLGGPPAGLPDEADGQGTGGPPSDLNLPPQAGGPGAPNGDE